jgi:hypothetical protein
MGSGFKGSGVDFLFTFASKFNGKVKKREAINPEPRTRNLLTQTDRMTN